MVTYVTTHTLFSMTAISRLKVSYFFCCRVALVRLQYSAPIPGYIVLFSDDTTFDLFSTCVRISWAAARFLLRAWIRSWSRPALQSSVCHIGDEQWKSRHLLLILNLYQHHHNHAATTWLGLHEVVCPQSSVVSRGTLELTFGMRTVHLSCWDTS